MSAGRGDTSREIERVWTLSARPTIPAGAEVWEIEQGYLAPSVTSEEALAKAGFPEGRLRRIVEPTGRERFFHTVKSGSGVVRVETEREITREEFEAAWPRTEGRRISKTRHRVRDGGFGRAGEGSGRELVWEIDFFHGLPLAMVEVELPDEYAACPFPAWLAPVIAREVSEDARYRNAALAMYGMP